MAVNTEIKGNLLKWTNYWGGWKQRWFVLSKGVLSYYNEEGEEDKGCKAAITLSAVDVNVCNHDITRFDIHVQNEQHWYLKCRNSLERQSWLIAIATCKVENEKGHHLPIEGISENHHKLKEKYSELKLYSELLVQQVNKLKKEALKEPPNVDKLSDASGLLSTACDTFLGTLDQCLSLAEVNFSQSGKAQPIHKSSHKSHHTKRSVSQDFDVPKQKSHPAISTRSNSVKESISIEEFKDTVNEVTVDENVNTIPVKNVNNDPSAINIKAVESSISNYASPIKEEGDERVIHSFFSQLKNGFREIVLEEDGGIPTTSFLSACENIIPFFNAIGSTAFAPVKIDINGNISKLRTKYLTDTKKFRILQDIVHQEVLHKTTKVRNSATDALLWLKRGLTFIYFFLLHIKNGNKNISASLNLAYTSTLKKYHGWVVQGVFSLAVKASPNYTDFIRLLAASEKDSNNPNFEDVLIKDIDEYLTAMEVVLTMIDNFYQKYDLDSDSVVS